MIQEKEIPYFKTNNSLEHAGNSKKIFLKTPSVFLRTNEFL